MQEKQAPEITAVINRLAAAAPMLAPARLALYVSEILRWNPRIGLISKHQTPDILERLVKQSVHLHELVTARPEAGGGTELSVVDVGTGGGFPGLIWAMLEPEWRFLLVERRHRKGAFLERVVRVLGLDDVEVFAGDAEAARQIDRFAGRFDVATTMAVGPPVRTAGLVEGFLRAGGIFATTVVRDEPPPGARVGAHLELLETHDDDAFRYALYMKR